MKLNTICLICNKQLKELYPSTDDNVLPTIDGGHVEITFGYGSIHDDITGTVCHLALICDECFDNAKKNKLVKSFIKTREIKMEEMHETN